jgi:hypothetical protein
MRLLSVIGLIAVIVGLVAAVYFFGGFYSVAATQADPPPVTWALVKVRQASIKRHATDRPPATLGDAATVQAGARAFLARGCTNCHGGPGVEWLKFSEGMQPGPPDLKEIVNEREPSELFWVIKHGINMTGMPSFGAIEVPDPEIWSIVGFLKKLPTVSEADFKAWSGAASAPAAR